MLLIGIDEAGYGPKIGPLCQGFTAIRCPDSADGSPPNLWKVLRASISKHPAKTGRIAIDDSKKIYSAGEGLDLLARGVSAFLECLHGGCADDHATLFRTLLPETDRIALQEDIWGCEAVSPAPRRNEPPVLVGAKNKSSLKGPPLRESLRENGVEILALGARATSARNYNTALASSGNKADVNWNIIAAELKRLAELARPREPIYAVIDRQGGRKFYAARISEVFAGAFAWVEHEGERASVYRVDDGERVARVAFLVEGDAESLPVALGSMAAKLTREICMKRLNEYFSSHHPALRPTAGYYSDANRFLRETQELRVRLGIENSALIRTK